MIMRHSFYPFMFMPGLLFWLLVVLGLIVLGLIVWAIVARGRSKTTAVSSLMPPHQEDSALTILRERFARGEISKIEFDEMRQTLASS